MDLCHTALGAYDAEQTNRVSSFLWGAGFPPNSPSDDHGWSSVAGAKDGGKRPWLSCRLRTSAGQGWPSVPGAKDGEKGPVLSPVFGVAYTEVC